MRAYIKTYGCTLNQADSDIMSGILNGDGIEISESEEASDVVIVNTCTVKTPTQEKILNVLSKLEKTGKKVVVTGCMASANQDLIEKYAPSASILTTSNIEHIAKAVTSDERLVFNNYNRADKLDLFTSANNIIAKIPVSEGCLSNCGFCETKLARGPLNSFDEEKIINAVRFSVQRGAKEIQLTSQDMGAYGLDKKTNIAKLMQKLQLIEGDFKIRIGMLNPEHLHKYLDGFASALSSDKFYKFVHLPVQSGSNKVLKEMKRLYTIEEFDGQIRYLREKVPGITIETDIIVGYPTENEEDLEQTLEFIRRTKPNVVNMCKFWSRPNTYASKLKQLPNSVIGSRSAKLGRVVRKVQQEINDQYIGKSFEVVVTEIDERSFNARMDSYKKVIIKNDTPMNLGAKIRASINAASCNVLYGEPIKMIDQIVV